jgi:hypothetical protein
MTGFDSAGTPSSTLTDTTAQASRKRPAPDVTTQQRQPTYDLETLSTVPREFRDKWDEVAGQETLVQLRLCLQTQRVTWTPQPEVAASIPEILDTSIGGQLSRYLRQRERGIRAVSDKHSLLTQVPSRLYLANVSNLYLHEKEARKTRTRKRVRRNPRNPDTANVRQASVLDEFVDFLRLELETGSINTRRKVKTKVKKLIQRGKRWARLVGRYGTGILLLVPASITDDE